MLRVLLLALSLQLCASFAVQLQSSACNSARGSSMQMMAGFGGAGGKTKGGKTKAKGKGGAAAAKKAALSPKRQWDIFRELQKDGAPSLSVFALDGDKSYWCGEVNAAAPATMEQSAAVHKRLILEHAVRCNPALTPRARELTLGVATSAEDAPEPLPKQEKLPAPQSVGYAGKADPSSGYYVTYGAASEAFTGSSKKLGMGGF